MYTPTKKPCKVEYYYSHVPCEEMEVLSTRFDTR